MDVPIGAIALKFGVRGEIADMITRAKFCDSQFRGFRVLLYPRFSVGLAGRP